MTLLLLGAAFGAENFLFLGGDDPARHERLVSREDVAGVQVIYSWKRLERGRGDYDFSDIERDLAFLEARGKKLFVQVQDRFFSPEAKNVPTYLLNRRKYAGGLVRQREHGGDGGTASGWAAAQWNPAVRKRFQALLKALGSRFDGRLYGINLPESAIEVREGDGGFDCDSYFTAELENLGVARAAFPRSHVVQYVNFWPCEWNNDRTFMERAFAYAAANGIGLGGPDVVPFRKSQMKNSYPFFHRYRGQLSLVAMAVQEPTLAYVNPETNQVFSEQEFRTFATDYLGADVLFWTLEAPWLQRSSR